MSDLRKSIWINAPPKVVFEYFIDAEKMVRWAGVRAELDPTPGGVYRLDMGVAGVVAGNYVEIEPGRFLSWTVNPPEGFDAPSSMIEITFSEEADGTRVDVRQTGLTPPFDAMGSRGWDHHLARLSVAAQGGSPDEDRLCERSMQSLCV